MTEAAPVDLIVAGDAIIIDIVGIVVDVSHNNAAEGGIGGASPLSSLTSSTAGLYLIPPLNVRR